MNIKNKSILALALINISAFGSEAKEAVTQECYTLLCKQGKETEKIEAPKKFIETSAILQDCIKMSQTDGSAIPVKASPEALNFIINETVRPGSMGTKINRRLLIDVLKTIDMLHITGDFYNRMIITSAKIFEKLTKDEQLKTISWIPATIACDILFEWTKQNPYRITGLVVPRRFSPDGSKIASVECDGYGFDIHDCCTGKTLLNAADDSKKISKIYWTHDGNRILTLNYNNTATMWNAITGGQLFTTAACTLVKCSPAENKFFISQGNRLHIYNSDEGRLLITITQGEIIEDAKWSPDGQRIVTISISSNKTFIWNAIDGTLMSEIVSPEPIIVKWSRNGEKIVALSRSEVTIHHGHTGALIQRINNAGAQIISASWNDDGTEIITMSSEDDKHFHIWNALTGRIKEVLNIGGTGLLAAKASPVGKKIMALSLDGTIDVWNAQTYTLIEKLQPDAGCVIKWSRDRSIKWSPDGTKMLVDTLDGIKLYIRTSAIDLYSKLVG